VSRKRERMLDFWSRRATVYEDSPRANTDDIWLREIEIAHVDSIIKTHQFRRVMDFGCANGYTTLRLAKLNQDTDFVGVDLNRHMIQVANRCLARQQQANVEFKQLDVTLDRPSPTYHLIFAIRAIQNIESLERQKDVFDALYDCLDQGGMFLYMESYEDGYRTLNEHRVQIGLMPLPVHEHLTLLTQDFDHHVSRKMRLLETKCPASSYYLITRLLYSCIANMNGEPIDYNHPLHRVAAMLPSIGDYGPLKASLYQKTRPLP
jgi:SAM-dependent methyltransferase